MELRSFYIIFLFLFSSNLSSQNLTVGNSAVEDYIRRSQLNNNYDSTLSFTVRPTTANEDSVWWKKQVLDSKGIEINLHAPFNLVEWNSHHPYRSNNGAITPGLGIQTLTRVGTDIKWQFISVQLAPELVASESLPYDGFPDTLSDRLWQIRNETWLRADIPERVDGADDIKLLPGQSHAILYWEGIGLGISNESLWWGPGKRNSLLMSNNARSFAHLTFRSNKPIPTLIGNFEWNLIAGRLNGSNSQTPSKEGLSFSNFRLNDWRYLSALTFSYQPKIVPGLSLGGVRVVQQYSELAKNSNDYLPVFINLFRQNDDLNRQETEIDQLISVFLRWFWQKEKAEIYFEFGRNDASLNIRDFLLGPQHSRAYIFGISKIFNMSNSIYQFQVEYEHTQMSQSANYLIRDGGSWYLHSGVRHGYTHIGEVLGASTGPGTNVDLFKFSLVRGLEVYGLRFERIANDLDFFYLAFEDNKDWRRFWVDYNIGLESTIVFKDFIFDTSIIYTRALNYQWELFDNPPGQPYFVKGKDVSNLFISLKTIYLFR